MAMRKGTEDDRTPKMFNPFMEMMAIEAEFGSLYESEEAQRQEQARNNSKWYPFFETISQKSKQ